MDKEANLLALGSFLAVSAGLTLFHTFPKDPLDISSVMFTVAGSHLQKHTRKKHAHLSFRKQARLITTRAACIKFPVVGFNI